ncbi:MAG: hypothetical protein CFE31_10920 [Rhizobiales bacterium PAR1]|nr:MAG: hypothetical protein CFE31_10920 [Rhizobiales bacterium PAR1]
MTGSGENAKGSSAPGDLNDALARLRGRVAEMQNAPDPRYADLGPASHPIADLHRLALLWRHAHANDFTPPEPGETLPGPATIAVVAEKLGLEVFWETMSLDSLSAGETPAVVLLGDGTSRLVVSRPRDEAFQLMGPNGLYIVAVKALDAAATGTVFRIQQLPGHHVAQHADEVVEAEAAPQTSAPVTMLSARQLILQALRGQGSRIVHLCVASALINLLGLALPMFSMAVFDRVIPHAAFDTLWALAIGVSLALLLELGLRHARLKLFDAVGLSAAFDLQGRLASRLLFAPPGNLPRAAGAILPGSQELEALAQIAPQLIVSLVVDVPFFVLLMIFIGAIGGPIVLAPIIGVAALVAAHALAHHMAHRSHATQLTEARRQIQVLLDSIGGIERIRATGAGRRFLSVWEQIFDRAGFAAHQNRYWHGLSAQISAVLVQAVIVAAVVIGVFRIDASGMTIGALSACTLLVNRALMPVSMLTGLVFRLIQGLEAIAQVAPLMNTPAEAGGDGQALPASGIRGKIDLHHVSFHYPGETRLALREISLVIRPGEKIGIIGKAGCGKSSLLKLIARLAEPSDGRIGIDDRDIRQFDPAELRKALSYMPQEAQLLDLTLHDNLTIGLPPVSQEQFDRITRLCGVHDFASNHPSGYSLPVGQGGQRLSGGERQSVSLARALMGNPATLMLDEPTSALDNGLEARVIAELKREIGATGLVVATHRLPVLALVDRIIWMDQGRIVADGPKDQVFAKLGLAA